MPRVRALGWTALWALSMAPLWPGLERALSGSSRFVLVASPWLFAAGIPRSSATPTTRPFVASLVPLALALPPLALASRLEAFDGAGVSGRIATAFAGTALFLLVLASAAERAAVNVRARRAHALAWFALIAVGPVLARCWSAAANHAAPRWLSIWASASPLEWLWTTSDARQVELARVLLPVCSCVVLAALAFRRTPAEEVP